MRSCCCGREICLSDESGLMKVLHFHNTGKLVRHWVASNFGLITFRGICDTKYKLLVPIPNILIHRWLFFFCLLFSYSIHIAVVLRKGLTAQLRLTLTLVQLSQHPRAWDYKLLLDFLWGEVNTCLFTSIEC